MSFGANVKLLSFPRLPCDSRHRRVPAELIKAEPFGTMMVAMPAISPWVGPSFQSSFSICAQSESCGLCCGAGALGCCALGPFCCAGALFCWPSTGAAINNNNTTIQESLDLAPTAHSPTRIQPYTTVTQ